MVFTFLVVTLAIVMLLYKTMKTEQEMQDFEDKKASEEQLKYSTKHSRLLRSLHDINK